MAKHINDLPNEMLLQIFSYCRVEDLVLYIRHVNDHWFELVRDAELWKHLSYFPQRSISTSDTVVVLKNAPLLRSLVLLENVDLCLINALCNSCPCMESLEFYDTQTVTTVMLERILESLPKLQNLTLRSMDIECRKFADVLGKFHNLKKLSLLHTFYTGADILKCVADGCQSLEYLRLDGMDVSDANVHYFITRKGSQLTGLLLDGFRLSAASLRQIKICIKLQSFMFYDCSSLTESLFSEIIKLPKLKLLQLPYAQQICSEMLASSLLQESLSHLVELDLTKSRLDDEGAKNIAHNCVRLRALNLAMCCCLSDEGMKYISQCLHLQRLNIKNCCLTDEGMKFLPGLPCLKFLNVSRTSVTDFGMVHVMKCSQLTALQINYCNVSAETIQAVSSCLKLLIRFSYIGCKSPTEADKRRQLNKQMFSMDVAEK